MAVATSPPGSCRVLGPQSSTSRSRGGREAQGHEKCRAAGSGSAAQKCVLFLHAIWANIMLAPD